MSVQIREFQPDDLEAIVEIAIAAWQPIFDSFRQIVGAEVFDIVSPNPEAKKRDRICEAANTDDPRQIWVAEIDGVIVGFITIHMYHERKVAEIGNNAVAPSHHSRGIGSAMYEFALAKMREAGIEVAVVTTGGDDAHAPARRAYEKAGFTGAVPSVEYHIRL